MPKKVLECKVVENTVIAKDIYRMVIQSREIGKNAKCGQFINVYPKQKHLLLPRPISISEIGEDTLTIIYSVVGEGTNEFSGYKAEDTVRVSTPLGNGFTRVDTKKPVVVGGGIGIPPLIELTKQLQGEVIAVLGFREEPFLVEELEKAGATVYIATESGKVGTKGNVIDVLKEKQIQGDYYYSCGPKPMLRALAAYCESIDVPSQLSLEERMGCGYGACVGCVCKIKEKGQIVQKKVCKDGPVFLGSEVVWDE